MINKRKTGEDWESCACEYLEQQGMKIVVRNFHCRIGEIDIIGYHNGYLVFIEVKYRKDNRLGTPEEAVNYNKQRKICMVSDYYRCSHKIAEDCSIRYDVVAICGTEIRWYQNAFEYIGY